MSILVTGGAGYIGSVTVELLRASGEEVIVYDNLSRGYRDAVSAGVPLVIGDTGDTEKISATIQKYRVDTVVHFAAYTYVGESVTDPARYFQNNVMQGMQMLDAMRAQGVQRIVFSSTCATYGEPQYLPLDEQHPTNPTSPYGLSKLMMEQILRAYDAAYGLRFVALRYFNAAGAALGKGERHDPETHLIPLVLQVAQGKRKHISVLGNDYPTPDGTCIRDYIHITDLGQAHGDAVRYLRNNGSSEAINLGTGQGHSVLEVIQAARTITGHDIPTRVEPRRPGDPSRLVAAAEKAHQVLGWKADKTLHQMLQSAWEFATTLGV